MASLHYCLARTSVSAKEQNIGITVSVKLENLVCKQRLFIIAELADLLLNRCSASQLQKTLKLSNIPSLFRLLGSLKGLKGGLTICQDKKLIF